MVTGNHRSPATFAQLAEAHAALPWADAVWLQFWRDLSEQLRLFLIARHYLWAVLRPPEFRREDRAPWELDC